MLIVPYLIPSYLSLPADIKKWWIWGYWISPISYAQNAISTNEFLGPSWNKVSTLSLLTRKQTYHYVHINNLTFIRIIQIVSGGNQTIGVTVLKDRGIFTEAKWYWIGLGAMVGYTLLFNLLYTVALSALSRKPI
jgi:hypothetical protein